MQRVLSDDNCTGCGVCALISDRITIDLDTAGFSRPTVTGARSLELDEYEAATFTSTCPGIYLQAPSSDGKRTHPVFGSYVQAWQGWAIDPDFRHAGSSGGVLTALANWLVCSKRAHAVAGSGMSGLDPTRTVPVTITSRQEALAAAGSRYAPVANSRTGDKCGAFIGKPCEVSGRHQLASHLAAADRENPVLLSFFCAGTPSQHATDDLAKRLGVEPGEVTSLRYRGNGWPGEFEVHASDGRVRAMSYEDSWGQNLGKRLQLRCKLCPDGTGEHADIAVGDYWETDDRGFPAFDNADGNSVIIARTPRGAALLIAAAEQGVLMLNTVDLDDVAAVQPLQTDRRRTLAGRLAGRRLAGHRVPRYRGYHLLPQLAAHSKANLRAAVGTFARSTGLRQ